MYSNHKKIPPRAARRDKSKKKKQTQIYDCSCCKPTTSHQHRKRLIQCEVCGVHLCKKHHKKQKRHIGGFSHTGAYYRPTSIFMCDQCFKHINGFGWYYFSLLYLTALIDHAQRRLHCGCKLRQRHLQLASCIACNDITCYKHANPCPACRRLRAQKIQPKNT